MVLGLFSLLSEQYEKHKKQYVLTGVFFVLISAISFGLHFKLGDFFLNNSYDFIQKAVGGKNEKPHKDVVLLLIDEQSLKYAQNADLGRWPWGRNVYPEILQFINAYEDAKPKGIFFDIIFAENDQTGGAGNDPAISGNDALFSQSVAYYGNIYHNVLLRQDDEMGDNISKMPFDIKQNFVLDVKFEGDDFIRPITYKNYTLPLPCLRSAVTVGDQLFCKVTDQHLLNPNSYQLPPQYRQNAAYKKLAGKIIKSLQLAKKKGLPPTAAGLNVAIFDPDSDGVNRRGKILFKYGEDYMPSLSLQAMRALSGQSKIEVEDNVVSVGDIDIPVDNYGDYMVNYYQDEFPSYSMSSLLLSAYYMYQGEEDKMMIKPDVFKDKIVIVGCSAVGCADLKVTPMSETFPGPAIHATIISNILQKNEIHIQSGWARSIWLLAVIFICIATVLLTRIPWVQLGVPLTVMALYTVLSMVLFNTSNYLQSFIFILSAGLSATAFSFTYLSFTEGAERRKYSKILGNMVDPSIVSEALNDLESLKKGGEKKICAFFSDVASFSTISEKLTAQQLADLLNEYLSAMTIALKKHGGTLDKYIGDAIVGIFGAPIDIPDMSNAAARASIEMQAILKDLHDKWVAEDAYCPEAQQMQFRIGLNTGIAKVGFMGTDTLASYTMMGDTVNLAARLEAAGKDYGVDTLVSEFTYEEIKEEHFCRKLDAVVVKGKTEPVKLYELVGTMGKVPKNILDSAIHYEKGYEMYLQRNWDGAIAEFNKAIEVKGTKDKSALMLIERCEMYKDTPPPSDWDGVFVRTHK